MSRRILGRWDKCRWGSSRRQQLRCRPGESQDPYPQAWVWRRTSLQPTAHSRNHSVWIPARGDPLAWPGRQLLMFALPEDRAADADMGGAELYSGGEIGAHAHRQIRHAVARGDFCRQREMRRRRLVNGRDAHQAGNHEPIIVATALDERIRLLWRDARLLRLLAGIELHEQLRMPFLGFDLLG